MSTNTNLAKVLADIHAVVALHQVGLSKLADLVGKLASMQSQQSLVVEQLALRVDPAYPTSQGVRRPANRLLPRHKPRPAARGRL